MREISCPLFPIENAESAWKLPLVRVNGLLKSACKTMVERLQLPGTTPLDDEAKVVSTPKSFAPPPGVTAPPSRAD